MVAFGCPLLALVAQVRESGSTVNEYKASRWRHRASSRRPKLVRRLHVGTDERGRLDHDRGHAPAAQHRRQMIERQLTHRGRGALRLRRWRRCSRTRSRIRCRGFKRRGAAARAEPVGDEDRVLSQLICSETERIREPRQPHGGVSATSGRWTKRAGQHPRRAQPREAGSPQIGLRTRHVRSSSRTYDPSLPPMSGQPRQARAGVSQPDQERGGSHRRSTRRGTGEIVMITTVVPARRAAATVPGSKTPASRCRS